MENRNTEIKFGVSLDENKLPVALSWEAEDSGTGGKNECKSVMISIWDQKQKSTLRIDLWTKDMPLDEMKRFFCETLASMSDTYARATGDKENADFLREFSNRFADKTGLNEKSK